MYIYIGGEREGERERERERDLGAEAQPPEGRPTIVFANNFCQLCQTNYAVNFV